MVNFVKYFCSLCILNSLWLKQASNLHLQKNNIFTVLNTKTTISFCPDRKNGAINVYGLISTTFTVKVFSQKLQQKPFDKNNIK